MLRRLFSSSIWLLQGFISWMGQATAWLSLALVLITSYDVLLRYFFRAGSVAVQELEWHVFALLFLLCSAWTLAQDKHVRVDILYSRLGIRGKAFIDAFGSLFFLIPFSLLVIHTSIPWVLASYHMGETSADPGGLPHRFLLKAIVPLAFVMLFLQGLISLVKSLQNLFFPDNSFVSKEFCE